MFGRSIAGQGYYPDALEQKKAAAEALAIYDTLAEDDSRQRFLCVWDWDRNQLRYRDIWMGT